LPTRRSALRGLFVTGTDTGVGKSVVAAALCAALVERGEAVTAFKPVVTGLDEPPDEWPADHELLAAGARQSPEQVAPYRFGPPLSPHYAAELAAETIEPARLVAAALAAGNGPLVAEGVGGLLVPITPGYLVRDLAIDLGLPLVIAARTGLGTINHTLLTIEAARAAGLSVAGVVMTPWPAAPEPIELSNRATVERLGGAPVSGLPPTDPGSLASAGSHLPLDEWLPWSG
jgi:dethiobiotin synthetase